MNREWFVSYDVTRAAIVVQYRGDDEHDITADEALLLSDELRVAVTAANEHRWFNGGPEPQPVAALDGGAQ